MHMPHKAEESIYENIVRPGVDQHQLGSHHDEPPPPPQPPYTMHGMGGEKPRPGLRLERDRERRSIRKLTKDSGYETSQYAESDYANLDWDCEQSSEAAASDRSPTNKSTRSPSEWGAPDDFSPRSSGIYTDCYSRDGWRGSQLYWSSLGSSNSSVSSKPSHRSSHHSSRHRDSWEQRNWGRSHGYNSSDDKPTSPPAPDATCNHRKTASYTHVRPVDTRADRNIGRYSSTDSLNSYSSSVFSYPTTSSVSSAKSTPALCHDGDIDDRRPPPVPSHAISSSRSTPNLEDLEGEGMVTRRSKKSTVYDALATKSGASEFTPVVQGHPYWEDHESRDNYEAQVRSAAVAAYQVQHNRQISSQSSGSDRTSSSYSVSQHSRQVSNQSSFSEEDYRIQSIKEEFHQRTSSQDYYQGPHSRYNSGGSRDLLFGLPPYSHKYYSSDNLAASYGNEPEVDPKTTEHIPWTKSQPDLKGTPADIAASMKSPTSPPPPPPVRDSSSLKYNRYGSGHEKYPSWPGPANNAAEDYLEANGDCAKNIYGRGKKHIQGFTQNLKTVAENSERDKLCSHTAYGDGPHVSKSMYRKNSGSFDVDLVYSQQTTYYYARDTRPGKEFNDVPSPPEREASLKKSLAIRPQRVNLPADDEDGPPPPYSPTGSSCSSSQFYCSDTRSQDQGYWSPDSKDPKNQLERELPQGETEDGQEGDQGTPLMDRLRQESQHSLHQLWSGKDEGAPGCSTGRESVTSSNSSQETLKWHGSSSDLSVHSERTRGGVETIVHSARVQPPQRHNSESVLYYGNGVPNNRLNVQVPKDKNKESAFSQRSVTKSPKKESTAASQCWADQVQKNNILNSGSIKQMTTAAYAYASLVSTFGNCDERRPESLAREEFRALPAPEYAKPLSVAERIQDLERQAHSDSAGGNSAHTRPALVRRPSKDGTNHRSVTSPTFRRVKVENGNVKSGEGTENTSEPKAHYLDPEKKHRVSDPELKAIQKQAVLKFFERQTSLANTNNSLSGGMHRRSAQSLPRECMSELKNNVVNMDQRLDRVPETSRSEFSRNETGSDVPARPPRLLSPNQRSHSVDADGTAHTIIHRPVPVRQGDASHRVAIYYNTYTQTLLTMSKSQLNDLENTDSAMKDSALCAYNVRTSETEAPTPVMRERLIPTTGDDHHHRLRKDIGLQTEWSWQTTTCSTSGTKAQQSKSQQVSNRPTTLDNAEAVPADLFSNDNVSAQLLTRLTGSSPNKRIDHHHRKPLPPTPSPPTDHRLPPERPPKRPHLQAASSPPPLLPRRSSPATTVTPPPPPPVVLVDEEQELVRIEQSAQELRQLLVRSASPDLPLPPPPPATAEEEELVTNDDPLPPPPTPNEVKQMLPPTPKPMPRSAGSPPVSYPKDSYMSYRNERHPGRQGFDGNYHRTTSPVSSSSGSEESGDSLSKHLAVHELEDDMESVATSLTPTAWERWHNIGRSGATVVFTSNDLKPSGALKPSTSNDQSRRSSFPRSTVTVETVMSEADGCQMSNYRRISFDVQGNRTHPGSRGSNDDLITDSSTNNGEVNHKLNFKATCSTSLESISRAQPLSAAYDQNGGVRLPVLSNSSPKANNKLGEARSVTLKEPCDEIRCQHKQVEVMTQTTPSIAKFGRSKHKEEVECEQLSHDFLSRLSAEDRVLQALLVPRQQLKTTADYMEGIFEMDQSKDTPARRISFMAGFTPPSVDQAKRSPEGAHLPADSAYFTTSESKAKFLTRYREDMNLPAALDMKDTVELGKKKEELVKSISRKLEILRSEHLAIQDEIVANEDLGTAVTSRVEKLAKSNEIDKYKLHVEEIDKITSLLLSLSGRLARAENALMGFASDAHIEERQILEAKRDKLFEQHEEAKKLKENIDRRSLQVSNFLHKYLSSEEYADYDHFIKMKSKLLMDSREIDEKIKLGEEQMLALTENLAKKR